jgi:hypothetical protein
VLYSKIETGFAAFVSRYLEVGLSVGVDVPIYQKDVTVTTDFDRYVDEGALDMNEEVKATIDTESLNVRNMMSPELYAQLVLAFRIF